MRTLLVASLILTAGLLAVAAPASADNYVVGNCQKSGACVGVCIADADTTCYHDGAICFGASYQVPQCIPKQR
ncbi:MAG: hypothetical protein QOJ26_1087 [Thermoplasmata archaeon]|jgi:hypothetical protein|nr:hypothetical protein [Thermoplasmata archaeon]MEA3166218.1 hypothetical protein [Thermoplasmata archaeon]